MTAADVLRETGLAGAGSRYGPRDAVTVLMAAGQRVGWSGSSYVVEGRRVTVRQLNQLARQATGQRFVQSTEPVFGGTG